MYELPQLLKDELHLMKKWLSITHPSINTSLSELNGSVIILEAAAKIFQTKSV